jgi:hypothetical protein
VERVTWRPVDADGRDLATGRRPVWPGWPDPPTALAGAPVVGWPLGVAGEDGRRLTLAAALGLGGHRVEALLGALAAAGPGSNGREIESLARTTPAGVVTLPLEVVARAAGVAAAARVDASWLAEVERRRAACRQALVAEGRGTEVEAALHVALLLATERLDPADDSDVEAHVVSGAQLWLLAGAVVSALSNVQPDPFQPWASLVAAGWWPIGPVDGRLVVCRV